MVKNKQLKQRITTCWFIILLGLMYHIILHLTPILYDIDIIKEEAGGVMPVSMILIFGFSFLIPVCAIINIQYIKKAKVLNIVLSILVILVNTGHLLEVFITKVKQPEQLFILIPLFVVALLLLNDSVKLYNIPD